MLTRSRAARGAPILALLAVLACRPAFAVAEDAAPPAATAPTSAELLDRIAPTVVSLRYVLKSSNREAQQTALGTVADPAGLVVLDNRELGRGQTRASDVKVLFGSDPKEWPAVVVARDAVLGLGWVQVVGLEKPIPAVDFAKGGTIGLGSDVRAVWRAGRGFDYAPVLSRQYVSAAIEKPRVMWNLSGDPDQVGLAAFDVLGRPVGVVTMQSSSATDDGSSEGGTFLLPLSDVRGSFEKAKKLVPEALKKAAENPEPAEKPAAMSEEGAEPKAPEEKPGTKPGAPPKEPPAETPGGQPK